MSIRRPYLLASGLWLAMVVCFFAPVLLDDRVIAPLDIMDSLLRPWAAKEHIEVHNAFTYDAISQYLPYDWSVYQSLRVDGYIGWNPYTHSGSSIVENTMLCPGDWHHHLYRFLPFWTSWNAGIILQFTIAGLGMLVMLREQKIPAAQALIGMIAFGFYSQFILWIHHRWVLGAMCWAPWILWSLLRAKRSHRLVDVPSVIFIGLAFRGGHLQSCIFVVLLVGIIAIAEWWSSENRWKPARISACFLPYAICGILGTVLALDVLLETVPALLHGKREMASRGWLDTLMALPTLVTSVFPTIMGTPQGLDVTKFFRIDLFSIKFMGAVPLLLAAMAFVRKDAPLTAKFLFGFGLLVPFTPADQWLYSRFTVVFALGGAWLAAWRLSQLAEEAPWRHWNKVFATLALVVGAWTVTSTLVAVRKDHTSKTLHQTILAKLPEGKGSRQEWMLRRADVFLDRIFIWHPGNLAMVALAGAGCFACSRIHKHQPKSSKFALAASFCAFGEMTLFASTWITFSGKPSGSELYDMPAWAAQLKQQTAGGSILCRDRSDFDFMQLNTPSAHGIRFAEGYETVTPRRIDPIGGDHPDSKLCASSGISHLLAPPGDNPGNLPGWRKVIDSKVLVLYQNLDFRSNAFATLADLSERPLSMRIVSPNRRTLDVPADTTSVTVLESYNPGWRYSIDGKTWNQVKESENHSIQVHLPAATSNSASLTLAYQPAFQSVYRPIICITLAGLTAIFIFQHRPQRQICPQPAVAGV